MAVLSPSQWDITSGGLAASRFPSPFPSKKGSMVKSEANGELQDVLIPETAVALQDSDACLVSLAGSKPVEGSKAGALARTGSSHITWERSSRLHGSDCGRGSANI